MILYSPKVSDLFHTQLMAGITEIFHDYLMGFKFATLCVPAISNVAIQPHGFIDIFEKLVQQLTQLVG